MIKIHFAIYIFTMVCLVVGCIALTRQAAKQNGMFAGINELALCVILFLSGLFITAIYGGIFWW